jgi:hypothetical protein
MVEERAIGEVIHHLDHRCTVDLDRSGADSSRVPGSVRWLPQRLPLAHHKSAERLRRSDWYRWITGPLQVTGFSNTKDDPKGEQQ